MKVEQALQLVMQLALQDCNVVQVKQSGTVAQAIGVCNEYIQELAKPPRPDDEEYVNIIFDGPPGPESGRFVEVENDDGKGINCGEWIEKGDMWALRIAVK